VITRKLLIIICLVLTIFTTPAYAYIGPGLGVGAFLTVAALVLGFVLLLFAFIWFPLKRMLRKRRQTETKGSAEDTPQRRDQ
jgi:hypothetical protein